MAMPKPSRVLTSSERSSSVELAKISTEGSQPNASVIALRTAARVSFGQSSQLLMRRRSTGEGASSDIIEAKISNLQRGVCAPLTRACHSLLSSFGQLHLNVHFTERNPDPDMPSRETNGFDPCVFPQENSCLPFLAMKTHAIFILENESIIRSGFPPTSLTLHSSNAADSPAAASSDRGARAPFPP